MQRTNYGHSMCSYQIVMTIWSRFARAIQANSEGLGRYDCLVFTLTTLVLILLIGFWLA